MSALPRRRLLSAAVATAALTGALLLSSGSAFATDTPPDNVATTVNPSGTTAPSFPPTSAPTQVPAGESATNPTADPATAPTTAPAKPTTTAPAPTARATAATESGSEAPDSTPRSCYVEKTIKSAQAGLTVRLINSKGGPTLDGPFASLMDGDKVLTTVNRTIPTNLASGIRIVNADGADPLFQQRSQGGDTPWSSTPFPKLPDHCLTAVQAGTSNEAHQATQAGQTTVVPVGAVAAGAELKTGNGFASQVAGAALALAAMAGLGFVVTRRRRKRVTSV